MPRPRTTYTAEYKLSAVKMITEQTLSVAEGAPPRRLGGPAPRLAQGGSRRWRRGLPRSRQPGTGRRRDAPAEGRERPPPGRAGSAKKAAAYFANPPT